MKKLVNIRITGGTYRNGRYFRGWAHAYIEGEEYPRYYPEGTWFDDIIGDLTLKGISCNDLIAKLNHWVKTGE